MYVDINFIEDCAKEEEIKEELIDAMQKLVTLLVKCHSPSNRRAINDAIQILKEVNAEFEL